MGKTLIYQLLGIFLLINYGSSLNSMWQWECVSGFCQKKIIDGDEESALSLSACRLFCSPYNALWPQPTGAITVEKPLVSIDPNAIEIISTKTSSISDLLSAASSHFQNQVRELIPSNLGKTAAPEKHLKIYYIIYDPEVRRLTLETDESYQLLVAEDEEGHLNATIVAETYFGARHGLETLGQLIIQDDLRDLVVMPSKIDIRDKPVYPYRGIALDTARNYIDVNAIKRTINAMGASKLNTFHWHITDSQSFPYVAASHPELSKYGAYSPKKVYTAADIEDIIAFGLEKGVRVMPEFDAPAHVGEGWQNSGLIVCFNAQPWTSYCVEPPCGQFDPTKDELYDVLEDLYGNMIEQFQPDIFHMGGDEVHFGCWNSVPSIVDWMHNNGLNTTERDFVKLWNKFQTEAAARVYKKAGSEIPLILWTSTLTKAEYIEEYVPKDKYIIQIWTLGNDKQITDLLDKGYRVILSNYDALYLDCGFAGWVNDGNNWCSPYIGWQKVYENKPEKIAKDKKNLVLGSEAALWTEQVDSAAVDSRLWPRAAAMAEVLWSEPKTSWREAEQRMLIQRERLVARGIAADALEPEWCWQNEGECPIQQDEPTETVTDSVTDKPSGAINVLVNFNIVYLVIWLKLFIIN